jgi:hypothetical protein
MINDSVPWRADLARSSVRLTRRLAQQRWHERTFFLVEKDLMVGFYSIRRLIESSKTSSRLEARRYEVKVRPLRGAEPRAYDRWSPWDHYDFQSDQRSEIDVRSLVNEFIHSFILMIAFDEHRNLSGVVVGSDRTKRTRLLEVPIRSIIDLFNYVANEDIVLAAWHDDEPMVRLSQHDLVEAGAASYTDDVRGLHEVDHKFPARDFATLTGLSARQLQSIQAIWAHGAPPQRRS